MRYEYNQIHMAFDANIVINMGRLDQTLFELHMPIKEEYSEEERARILENVNAYFKDKEIEPDENQRQPGFKEGPYLQFLLYMNYLLNGSKKMVGYITPTVFAELFIDNTIRHHYPSDKLKYYIQKTYRLVKFGEDGTPYPQPIIDLAIKYIQNGVFEETAVAQLLRTVPNNDAFITAEAAYAGLNLITDNIQHFIHRKIGSIDFNYRDVIEKINEECHLAQQPIENGIKLPGKIVPTIFSTTDFNVALRNFTYQQCEPNLSAPYKYNTAKKKSNKPVKPGHYRKNSKDSDTYKANNYLQSVLNLSVKEKPNKTSQRVLNEMQKQKKKTR